MSSETEKILIAVAHGFDDVYKRLDGIEKRMATKADLDGVEQRLTQRIEILEHRVLTEHSTRLDVLEDNMRRVKTKLGIV